MSVGRAGKVTSSRFSSSSPASASAVLRCARKPISTPCRFGYMPVKIDAVDGAVHDEVE